ncbi:MAG: NAD(P)H-hydrate epimerase [Bacteroidales bacterium]|nr:NAD(P)H-hydrate epimerase [Bacteroidales bacterium]
MITHFTGNVPFITKDQMIEVDHQMGEKFNIDLFQMMENAGLNLAVLAREIFLKGDTEKEVLVFAGAGANGGGAMVAARRLRNWGYPVKIVLAANEKKLRPVTKRQHTIATQLNIPFVADVSKNTALILDGIIGYNVAGTPTGPAAKGIKMINDATVPVLALDCPSGLDLATGKPATPTVKAKATMTLGIPKKGLFKMTGSKFIGDIFVADIGIPPEVYDQFGIKKDHIAKLFAGNTVVKVNRLVVFG